ncbi:hypothetical protein LDL08_31345 [Nonomuraea glycinis]|uniref:Uncharacterized protein n=1 Tax=Nonomuraea glycinis TaxID=2047744 RepID=A0A918E8E4_9ACTN|nr:hypothetical protein [Nonomuraea glycinis]MCA2180683.1 hypothetical protein [Nonomuraea glycinis]GGP11925.1 hypothetical protein GCM10012278_57630 [Nonomuraea glycinis]
MNRGWIVGGALVLVAVPAAPAAAAGVTMVLGRVDDSAGSRAGAGDVLRYRVRFDGTARDARLAVATTPPHALTALTCTSPVQAEPAEPRASTTRLPLAARGATSAESPTSRERPSDGEPYAAAQGLDAEGDGLPASSSELSEDASPQGISAGSSDGVSAAAALAARTLVKLETSGSSTAVVSGAQACALGELAGRRAVDVELTVPEGTGEVALAAVARMRQGTGLTTMTEATGVPVRAPEPVRPAGAAADAEARTNKPSTVRQRDAEATGTTRRRLREPGMGVEAPRPKAWAREVDEGTRLPEGSEPSEVTERPEARGREVDEGTRQSEGSEPTEVNQRSEAPEMAEAAPQSEGSEPSEGAERPEAPEMAAQEPGDPAQPEVSAKQGKKDKAGIVRQSGKAEAAGERNKAGGVRPGARSAEGVRPGGLVGGVARPEPVGGGLPPGVRGGVDMGMAGDLWREPAVGGTAEGKGKRAAELPLAAVPTAAAASSVTGVSMDGQGAPLPRAVAAPRVRLQAAEVVNPLAGGRGLVAAAGGIGALMAGLWAISRTHRTRTRRKLL